MIKPSMITIVLCVLTLQFAPNEAAHAGGWNWNCESETVTDFWEGSITGSELSGRGTICASSYGLWSTLAVKGLTPGNAYTVWWVYVDDPASCVNFPLTPETAEIPFPEPIGYAGRCGLADFFGADESGEFLNPLIVYGRMDSVVAGKHKRTRFSGDVRSFRPSSGSQVWMFVFGHGPADYSDKRQLARQLLTPEDPLSGVPHLGIEGRPYGYPAGVVVVDFD